ncbi:MAG: VacJ family lipoprotein [Thermodesulfatator sp.]|nr:MAG: VacJ family lipoprotein [Thermodesulfatator sp.]
MRENMKKYLKPYLFFLFMIVFAMTCANITLASDSSLDAAQGEAAVQAQDSSLNMEEDESYLEEWTGESGVSDLSDPLEPVNRVFYHFNDKLYFWGIKPVCKVYNKVFPEPVRRGFKNFFSNVYTPVRAANCLLQGKVAGFWKEIARFIINTTSGYLGFRDAAFQNYRVEKSNEDFGQTLAVYGLGNGPYLVIPFIGPTTLRDGAGIAADGYLNPPNYFLSFYEIMGKSAGEKVNDVSLRLGEYESFKETAIDPYVSIRQAYYQYRQKQIAK